MDVSYERFTWWYGGRGLLTIIQCDDFCIFYDGVQIERVTHGMRTSQSFCTCGDYVARRIYNVQDEK